MPTMMALAYDNPVIVSNWGSFPELLYEQSNEYFDASTKLFRYPGAVGYGDLLDGQLTNVFNPDGGMLYTGKQRWFEPNLCQLSAYMYKYYELWKKDELYNEKAKNIISKFSIQNVGRIIKQQIQ